MTKSQYKFSAAAGGEAAGGAENARRIRIPGERCGGERVAARPGGARLRSVARYWTGNRIPQDYGNHGERPGQILAK